MSSASHTGQFKRNSSLIGATVDDELVMMSVEHGQYYGLGGVGPRVWELLEEPRKFDELVELILQEFEVEREVCEKDMVEFLEQMEKLGLIERS
ncbi:MAG: lasso peptide biosynthesis PqqD family chaperone [Wenzhouxiangella sp.]